MKRFVVLALAIFFVAQNSLAFAQNVNWQDYSPPRSGFSVETPAPLRKVKSFDGEHGVNWDSEQYELFFSSYAAIETTADDCRFGVVVVDGMLYCFSSVKREKLLEYLSWLFFADVDELQFMRAPIAVKYNGLMGKEYFYIKESTYSSNLYTRGRIFDTGNKIYVIVFRGQNIKDLTSPDAGRFLNSFRLRRRR